MWGIFCIILSVPQNIVMDLNNVILIPMSCQLPTKTTSMMDTIQRLLFWINERYAIVQYFLFLPRSTFVPQGLLSSHKELDFTKVHWQDKNGTRKEATLLACYFPMKRNGIDLKV